MSDKDKQEYDDIINLPHHVSTKHPQMALLDRAAQFSPFAALTGHEAAIKETARLTEERLELDENSKEILNERLQIVREYLADRPDLKLTYFVPDERKKGGMYVTVEGKIKKIDEYERMIMLENGVVVLMDDLYAIDGDMFNK